MMEMTPCKVGSPGRLGQQRFVRLSKISGFYVAAEGALKIQGMKNARKMRHFRRFGKCKEWKIQETICIVAGVGRSKEWKMHRWWTHIPAVMAFSGKKKAHKINRIASLNSGIVLALVAACDKTPALPPNVIIQWIEVV